MPASASARSIAARSGATRRSSARSRRPGREKKPSVRIRVSPSSKSRVVTPSQVTRTPSTPGPASAAAGTPDATGSGRSFQSTTPPMAAATSSAPSRPAATGRARCIREPTPLVSAGEAPAPGDGEEGEAARQREPFARLRQERDAEGLAEQRPAPHHRGAARAGAAGEERPVAGQRIDLEDRVEAPVGDEQVAV